MWRGQHSDRVPPGLSKYLCGESVCVNIFISLILFSISFISSLKLNSAPILKTKFGMWFCCTNGPFGLAASVIWLKQREFCCLDCWIVWETSCFCSRWLSIVSHLNPCLPAKSQVRRDHSLCQDPWLPHIPLPLSHTGGIPLCLRKPFGHTQIPTPSPEKESAMTRHRAQSALCICRGEARGHGGLTEITVPNFM